MYEQIGPRQKMGKKKKTPAITVKITADGGLQKIPDNEACSLMWSCESCAWGP